jgi:hypothetical protein
MYPEPVVKPPLFTPKILIICGIIVIALTVGINYAYNAYLQSREASQNQGPDDEPTGESVEVEPEAFTFSSEEQKYSIDYPKGILVRELPKSYYQASKRLFEAKTEFSNNKKTVDPEYFKMIITAQRTYKDDVDKAELLTSILTSQRFCPASEYKKQTQSIEEINQTKFAVRKNVRGCGAPYSTFFDSFTRVGTYVIQVQSAQPYERVKNKVEELLNTLYLDSA